MVGKVLFVVDDSVRAREAATLAHGLLPKATEVTILQVVPQLPAAWTAWPAFPDSGEDLAKASAYVAAVGQELEALGWHVSIQVHFSVLGAGEIDREVLKLAGTLRPDLICLALALENVIAAIVREAVVPVLVAKPSSPAEDVAGRRERRSRHGETALASQVLLRHPGAALVFRQAGIL